jgi:DNA processing protein
MKAAQMIRPLSLGMNAHERLCLMGLSQVEFLRPKEKRDLVQEPADAARLFTLPLSALAEKTGRRLVTKEWKPGEILRTAEEVSARLTREGMRSIFYWDSDYPPLLRQTIDPPLTLYLRGSLPPAGTTLAAIVGTRFPTGAAREAAFRLGFELGCVGIGVVSGLARGIDTEAHEGCEEAGGLSVAVLGNGIDTIYPSTSRAAAAALLARGGAIVSEYPPGVPPLRWHFPARNRIISGLCRGVVVVQAPARSGALFTADYALQQGRDLWVHAAGQAGTVGEGTRALAGMGAPVIHGAAEILSDWGVAPRPAKDDDARPEEERIAGIVRDEINGACARRSGETYWRT